MSGNEREGRETAADEAPRARADAQRSPTVLVVMGVAGAGKTTIGRAVALSLGWSFHDADDFHTAASVAKMRAATPLTDADRAPWLAALRVVVGRHLDSGTPAVLACSALRESYRAALLPPGTPEHVVSFVQLDVSPALARERLSAREGHYMPASLVASQFITMEEPRGAMRLDGSLAVSDLVARICKSVEPSDGRTV